MSKFFYLSAFIFSVCSVLGSPVLKFSTNPEPKAKVTPPSPINPKLPPEERAFKAWIRTVQTQLKQTRERNLETMRARMQELKRINKLTPEQSSLFELACKGTVERATQAWLEAQENYWRARRTGRYLRSPDPNSALLDPSQNSVWTNAVSIILDEEQKDAYKAEMGERTIYQARLSILKVIAKVDRKARLSANQREKLLSLVEASLTIPLRDVNVRFDEASVKKAFDRTSQEKLKELLSPEQLTVWNKNTGQSSKEGNALKVEIKLDAK